ncbi:protein MCM10 homolog isoform X2 [Planococcus citri]|uniref:protein MCM10 homolog isoform X2 n=1 Tax=Planococcus citri TaxID=170843 RepID=UPI0031FA1EE6
MDNIDLLLESLDSHVTKNDAEEEDIFTNAFEDRNTSLNLSFENDSDSLPKGTEIETAKKSVAKKYSEYGYEIHRQLKEKLKASQSQDRFETHATSWKSQSSENKKNNTLSVTQTVIKNDVYAEPIFGLRLINPVVSSQFIQSKMIGRTPVTLARLQNHLSCGNKNTDWVFAGAIVFKSGLRTSQKGSQYCLWKISDLKNDLKQVTVYLFGKAGSELWKHALGTVVAILNASSMNKDEVASKDEITLSVRNADQVMIWGMSRDYGICKAKKKNGENCTSFVNKSACEFCVYHVKSEYNKYTGKRFDLQASYSNGLTELRNKVLGKNEVFYGGKSFSAVKPPSKNNKHRQKDINILNNLCVKSPTVEQFKNQSKSSTSDQQTLEKLKENVSNPDTQHKNNYYTCDKPLVSARMNVLKEAGKKLLQTGEVTRITAVNIDKRKTFVSFATVFNPESTSSNEVIKSSIQCESNASKPKENSISTASGTEKTSTPFILKPCKEIVLDFDEPLSKKSTVTQKSEETYKSERAKTLASCVRSSRNTSTLQSSLHSPKISNSSQKSISQSPTNRQNKNTLNSEQEYFLRTKMQSLERCSAPQPSNSIHKRRLDQAKMNAIRLIKQEGGISKTNPNQVRPVNDGKRTAAVKRALEENDEREDEELDSVKKSVLSKRFVDLMNAQSTHENLAQLAADMEEQNYFNKMEKKEQLEEKMLSTYKVACKAVSCLKCKYKWFSASDLCKAEGHPIKVIDAMKRFFKCQNCSNRTISLDIVPLISCKNCGSSKWSRAPMIKEKICRNSSTLSIRGDEVKFLDSFGQKQNLNLLVPE